MGNAGKKHRTYPKTYCGRVAMNNMNNETTKARRHKARLNAKRVGSKSNPRVLVSWWFSQNFVFFANFYKYEVHRLRGANHNKKNLNT